MAQFVEHSFRGISSPAKPSSVNSSKSDEPTCPGKCAALTAFSSEPILFPKLRIRFADFPCLHCSIGQRLFTLET